MNAADFDAQPLPRTVVRTSGNRKVGAHTVTTARTRDTCPTDCDAWTECYGTNTTQTGGNLFDNVSTAPAAATLTAAGLARAIGRTSTRALRFNVVGDFLSDGGTRIDTAYIAECNAAAQAAMDTIGPDGKPLPVWSYTHAWRPSPMRPHVTPDMFVTPDGRPWTVRASTASLDGAREAIALGWAPAVIVAPDDPILGQRLNGDSGPRVIHCPAQVRAETTCETCKLCAVPSVVVAFTAHGAASNRVRRPNLPVFTHTA